MRLLIDTHVFLWFILDDPQLSVDYRNAIQEATNEVFLSVASVWEAIIKSQLGKLPLPEAAGVYLPAQRARHQIACLRIEEQHLVELAKLPTIHRDPFDRILIAQARQEGMKLLSIDSIVKSYPVDLL